MQDTYRDLDAVLGALGQPLAEFKPAQATLVGWLCIWGMAALLGLAGLGAGLYWAISHGFQFPLVGAPKNQPDWAKLAILFLGSLSVGIFGTVMFMVTWPQRSNRVLVYQDGFVVGQPKKVQVFRWEDIEKILQDHVEAKPSSDGSPPMRKSTTFLVKRKDGVDFGFSVNTLQDHRQFARRLYAEAQARGIEWEYYRP